MVALVPICLDTQARSQGEGPVPVVIFVAWWNSDALERQERERLERVTVLN